MPLKYSVVLATLSSGGGDVWQDPDGVLSAIATAGYDGVDLDAEPDRIDQEQFDMVARKALDYGLQIPSLVGAWGGWHAGEERDLASTDESKRQYAVNYARRCLDLGATLDKAPIVEICAVSYVPEYPSTSVPHAELSHQFEQSCREIATHAEHVGVNAAIEPINRFEGYAGFMNSVTEALGVIESVGSARLGLLIDFFHVNIEDGPVTETLRAAGNHLMHIHLADSNRQIPGTGHMDFGNVIRVLYAMDYKGYLSLDCVPARPDWRTVLTASQEFLQATEAGVELQLQLNDFR
jgi:sugar phosphate isomerase/epimerase